MKELSSEIYWDSRAPNSLSRAKNFITACLQLSHDLASLEGNLADGRSRETRGAFGSTFLVVGFPGLPLR